MGENKLLFSWNMTESYSVDVVTGFRIVSNACVKNKKIVGGACLFFKPYLLLETYTNEDKADDCERRRDSQLFSIAPVRPGTAELLVQ